MKDLIEKIREAHSLTLDAIHRAVAELATDPEFAVLHGRLQEIGVSLHEAENQAVRIKTRVDFAGEDDSAYEREMGDAANAFVAPER